MYILFLFCGVFRVAIYLAFYYLRQTPSVTSQLKNSKLTYQTCRTALSDTNQFDQGYLIVAKCPPVWEDTGTAHSCYSTNYTADPLTAIPVQDIAKYITYANVYCAICHGKSKDLHLWSLEISSMLKPNLSLHDIRSSPVGASW